MAPEKLFYPQLFLRPLRQWYWYGRVWDRYVGIRPHMQRVDCRAIHHRCGLHPADHPDCLSDSKSLGNSLSSHCNGQVQMLDLRPEERELQGSGGKSMTMGKNQMQNNFT